MVSLAIQFDRQSRPLWPTGGRNPRLWSRQTWASRYLHHYQQLEQLLWQESLRQSHLPLRVFSQEAQHRQTPAEAHSHGILTGMGRDLQHHRQQLK